MPKKSGKSTAKPKTMVTESARPRRLKPGQYKSLRLQKRIKHPVKLSNVWQLTRQSARLLWQYKRLFVGITLIYGVLNVVLAQGLSGGTDVTQLKQNVSQAFTGQFGPLISGLSVFTTLVGSAGSSASQTASAYQLFLAIIGSLAIIWTLRQVLSGNHPGVRDAYYHSMYPLVPFILVLFVIGLQLIPLVVGSTLYTLVINNGIAVYAAEKIIWALLAGALALLTLYMLSSSVFALYIVTLPDMAPLQALRSARELVRYRRWTVLRKMLCLPIIFLIVAIIIMVPIIIVLTPLARWVFFILTTFALLATHGYMYTLYRELLDE
jgi:hypothetical protein